MLGRSEISVLLIAVLLSGGTAVAQRDRWGGPRNGERRAEQRNARQEYRDQRNQQGQSDRQERPGNRRSGAWLQEHKDQSLADQQRALESDPNFRKLSPQQQDRLRNRLQFFNSLPPDRRELMIQRMQAFDRLTPEQQQRGREMGQNYRNLPRDRRRALGDALRSMRGMSQQERMSVIDSPRFQSMFSESERNLLRGMTELNIGPARDDDDSLQ